jgi:hypothetical protein
MALGRRKRKEEEEPVDLFNRSIEARSAKSLAYYIYEALLQASNKYVHLSFQELGLVNEHSFIVMLHNDFIESDKEKDELKRKVISLQQDLDKLMGL